MVVSTEYGSECGIHVDDGTLNNYLQLYVEYESAGKCRIYRRVVTGGGAPVETSLVTGLPNAMYGLRMANAGSAGNWTCYFYSFKDVASYSLLTFTAGITWAAARLGLFFTKGSTGTGRGANVDWWSDSFT
jgi:hypothetical protein